MIENSVIKALHYILKNLKKVLNKDFSGLYMPSFGLYIDFCMLDMACSRLDMTRFWLYRNLENKGLYVD